MVGEVGGEDRGEDVVDEVPDVDEEGSGGVDTGVEEGKGARVLHMSMMLATVLTIEEANPALENALEGSTTGGASPSERSRGMLTSSEYLARSASVAARFIERPRSKPVQTETSPSKGSGGKGYGEKTRKLRVWRAIYKTHQHYEHMRQMGDY